MSLRSILVHADDSPAALARAGIALELATAHGATASALVIAATPPAPYGPAAGAFAGLRTEVALKRREAAEAVARRVTASSKMSASVLDTSLDRLVVDLASRLRSADLCVVAAPRPNDSSEDEDVVEAAMFASGRPVMVIPPTHGGGAVGKRIAVAWKDCREAARAVHDAAPLLEHADSVRLVSVHSEDDSRYFGAAALERIADNLRAHGVRLEESIVKPTGPHAEEALLSIVGTVNADLLVMGGYGRSRMSEILFGGFTQHVLRAADIAVLMSH